MPNDNVGFRIEEVLRHLGIVPDVDVAGQKAVSGPVTGSYNQSKLDAHLRFNLGTAGLEHDAIEVVEMCVEQLVEKEKNEEHSCDKELRASRFWQPNRCVDGQEWTCFCGKVYLHVCDEAEGCSWILLQDTELTC